MFDAVDFKWKENKKKETKREVITNHVMIETSKLKQLIIDNSEWDKFTLHKKIEIAIKLAYFENDKELLGFLIYMEE